ncbi:dihydrofolate reductase [Hazenella sp. IB182357]|uniref:Dihydrofolate reductase n=1 Tax=Polycladospora coralii TaxID=2771432 RepID=A0A926NFP7_9BACL|nr:dihydrofolate reductase [Polycladospora coralii]MBD1372699.1 dihydrofolate reductase [Polycladospora coralii]
MFEIIVAKDRNGVIGKDGDMPWGRSLPADLQHFKKLTVGKTVIMGHNTARSIIQSLGKLLPDRNNIILSRQKDLHFSYPNSDTMTFDEVLQMKLKEPAFVIGGEQIYQLFAPHVTKAYITEIDYDFDGDTYFPNLPGDWKQVSSTTHKKDEKNKYDCTFYEYEKRSV